MPAAKAARAKSSSPAAAKPSKSTRPEFVPVFAALRQIVQRSGAELKVISDKAGDYQTVIPSILHRGRPLYFAAVRAGKSYVSFHLMSVYYNPALLKAISPALKKRMQGKACFNFTTVDEDCFAELERLVAAGLKKFKSQEFREYIQSIQ
jgi:hypothetical protein